MHPMLIIIHSFRSFCYWMQNECSAIPFTPKTECIPREDYRLFRLTILVSKSTQKQLDEL